MQFPANSPPAIRDPYARKAIEQMNEWGKNKRAFLFIIDFMAQKPLVIALDEVDENQIKFNIQGFSNATVKEIHSPVIEFWKKPFDFDQYKKAFKLVKSHIDYGNTYLINLSARHRIESNLNMEEIFYLSQARYKLWLKDRFVCFSPEIFVQINEGIISSYPMKGTIDAHLPDAEKRLLEDQKELAEHTTIVDLIRNDLNRVAKKVRVEKFRYVEEIQTNQKKLLQVSSQICGELDGHYQENIGDIVWSMLPAGSISGAPKKKTVEIILEAEGFDRGYFTGIFGYFDGSRLDSGVMIRFIEQNEKGELLYKSGGGVTAFSEVEKEYQELIDKIYLPL